MSVAIDCVAPLGSVVGEGPVWDELSGTLYWVDVIPPPGVSAVPLQDLFAGGINSQIAVQPCPPPVPAAPATTAGTAAATPRPMASLPATARNPTGPAAGPPKLP